jgi:hypothetical protein
VPDCSYGPISRSHLENRRRDANRRVRGVPKVDLTNLQVERKYLPIRQRRLASLMLMGLKNALQASSRWYAWRVPSTVAIALVVLQESEGVSRLLGTLQLYLKPLGFPCVRASFDESSKGCETIG